MKGVKKSDLNADEAIKACQKAVQEYPNKFLYKTLLARSLEKKLDFREALKLFIVAAENGEKYAQEALAAYYFNGNLVEKDFKKAFDLSLLSAKQGNSEAMFAVAFNFFNGYGTDINIDKALKWYEKAAKAKMKELYII